MEYSNEKKYEKSATKGQNHSHYGYYFGLGTGTNAK